LQRFKHRNIFFDIGTNDGSSIEFFLNSSFQGGLTTQGGHDTSKLHGSGADGTWHIVAVEANPRFTPRLTKLKDELKELGKVQAFHLYNGTALTSYDGEITFFFDSPGGDAGASTMKDSFSVKENNNITVTALDVNTLFHSHMKVSVKDFVVVKIDIEGAEFEMMRRIISHSLLKYIDVIAVEWHDTNYWVYGQNETQRAYYSKKRECIQWILDESKNVVQDAWGRR
jgi:FkbM family methyltransferase